MKLISGGVCAAKGFKANGLHCGIRPKTTKKDLYRADLSGGKSLAV